MAASSPFLTESSNHSNRSKKRGNLGATLDPLLEPRLAVGHPGRPKGARNYIWTPEADKLLAETCSKWGPAKAKRIVGLKIQESRQVETQPRSDSVRKAVERRIAQLGLVTGKARKNPSPRETKRWTQAEITALLGALGADASIETIAVRTGHSVKAVRAKIARLDYQVEEIHGFAVFTVDQLAHRIRVTPRQIRRWKEKRWLETKNRRITEEALERFLREHPGLIPFDTLPREDQVYLIDLGYPCVEQKKFRKSADSGGWRSAFRTDVDHDSEVIPISVPN